MRTARTLLLALILIAVVGPGARVGTFASFSATTTNTATFATGTLVLSDTVVGGTTCISSGGGTIDTNETDDCDTVFPTVVQKPGDVASGQLILTSEGSLPGTLSGTTLGCETNDVPAETYHGSGELCPELLVQVQEYTDASFGMFSAVPKCVYPVVAEASCGWSFASLEQMVTDTTLTPMTFASPSVAPGESRYLRITLWWLDLGSNHNPLMGRQADFNLRWSLEQ